jgi:hypothetical protein
MSALSPKVSSAPVFGSKVGVMIVDVDDRERRIDADIVVGGPAAAAVPRSPRLLSRAASRSMFSCLVASSKAAPFATTDSVK